MPQVIRAVLTWHRRRWTATQHSTTFTKVPRRDCCVGIRRWQRAQRATASWRWPVRAKMLALLAVAALSLGGFVGPTPGPNTAGSSPSAHTIYGTGGPMDGLWESALAGDYRLSCFHEDFDAASMPNATAFGGSLDPAWATSGWTVTGINTPASALVRSHGGSLLVVFAGTGASDSVNAIHNGLGRLTATAATVVSFGHIFKIRQMLLGDGDGYYNNLENRI